MSDRIDWSDAPIAFTFLPILPPPPLCPHCGSEGGPAGHVRSKSKVEGDGSVSRQTICGECSAPFVVAAEPVPDDLRARVLAELMPVTGK